MLALRASISYLASMKRIRLAVAVGTFTLSILSARAGDQTIALKAARLFDGKSKTLLQNAVVIVQGDKIVDLASNLPIPDGAKVIDLGDATLSPGFMDAHTHLTLDFSGDYNIRRIARTRSQCFGTGDQGDDLRSCNRRSWFHDGS